MAIKYAGDRNLIGYGKAQVWKERDLTKGVRYEHAKAAKKAKAKAKQKEDNQKNLTDLLKEVDYSNVRNADVSHFKSEFDTILSDANKVTATGVNPLTNIELRKKINTFKANVMSSVNAKDVYDKNLVLATTNEDFQNESNIYALEQEYESSMFGEGANFYPTEDVGAYGEPGYVSGSYGNKAVMNPELDVEGWYKTNTENLTLQEITLDPSGEYKHTAQNGKTQFFKTKEEASDYQLNLAANDILNNHRYDYAFKSDQKQAAIEATETGAGNYIDENDDPDVLAYIKDQIRSRTTEVKHEEITDLPRSQMNITMSSGDQPAPAAGEDMPIGSYDFTGVKRVVDGVPVSYGRGKGQEDNAPLRYSTVTIPPVYQDVQDPKFPNDPTKTIQELVTPELKGQTFDFGQKPLDIRPEAGSGFMLFGENAETTAAGLEFGYNTSGENINFIPNSIVFNNTAKKDLKVKMPDGSTHEIQQGEIIDNAFLEALNKENRQDDYEAKPWLQGKEKNGMTISIGFDETVHARFATFVNTQSGSASVRKQNRKVYEDMMKGIGVEPKPLNGNRKPK